MHKQSNLFWDDNKGPFENICTIIQGGAVLFGSITQKVIITISELLGISLISLGKRIDEILQIKTIEDALNLDPLEAAEKVIEGLKQDAKESVLGTTSLLDFKGLRKEAGIKGAMLSTLLKNLAGFFSAAFTLLKRISSGAVALWAIDEIREGKKLLSEKPVIEGEPLPSSTKNRFPIVDMKHPGKHEAVDMSKKDRDRATNKNPFNQIVSDILSK